MNILIVGSVAFDSITTPFVQADEVLGGSATYFSLAASYFTKPLMVAVVGEDFKPEHEKVFAKKNISTQGLERVPGKTFRWAGKYDFDLNNRTTLYTHLNVFENFEPKLPEVFTESRFAFLGNIHPSLQKNVLGQIKNPEFVGLDTMNFWIEKEKSALLEVLQKINLLIINDSEARELTGLSNIHKAAKNILSLMDKEKNPILVIKRGEYGMALFEAENYFSLPAFPIEDVLDPTGAGDSFAGGFMGYLASTENLSWENLKRASVAGSTMASFCVETVGVGGLLNISQQDIELRLNQFKKLTTFEND